MKPWLIHIGYPKCGSTWMQSRLFPRLEDIEFLGKRYESPGSGWTRQVRDKLVKAHCFDFSPEEILELIEVRAGPAKDRPRLLSFEGLSGGLWRASSDSKRTADRLKATFPKAKILMITRRQVAHIESIYKQYLLTGGVLPIERFLQSDSHHLQFSMDSLRYDRLAEYYIQLYGRENVEVLPFEWLSADPQGFSDAICHFFESSPVALDSTAREYVRRGYSARLCALVRRLNSLRESGFVPWGIYRKPNVTTKSKLGPLNPYVIAEIVAGWAVKVFGPGDLFSAERRAQLEEFFRASNQRLASFFPVLAEDGYSAAPLPALASH